MTFAIFLISSLVVFFILLNVASDSGPRDYARRDPTKVRILVGLLVALTVGLDFLLG